LLGFNWSDVSGVFRTDSGIPGVQAKFMFKKKCNRSILVLLALREKRDNVNRKMVWIQEGVVNLRHHTRNINLHAHDHVY